MEKSRTKPCDMVADLAKIYIVSLRSPDNRRPSRFIVLANNIGLNLTDREKSNLVEYLKIAMIAQVALVQLSIFLASESTLGAWHSYRVVRCFSMARKLF
jgi:hypothetical protein